VQIDYLSEHEATVIYDGRPVRLITEVPPDPLPKMGRRAGFVPGVRPPLRDHMVADALFILAVARRQVGGDERMVVDVHTIRWDWGIYVVEGSVYLPGNLSAGEAADVSAAIDAVLRDGRLKGALPRVRWNLSRRQS
jgi:hypothetical protein